MALSLLVLGCCITGCASHPRGEASPAPSSAAVTVTSEADADTAMAKCLRAHGWTVFVSPSGGVQAEFPNEQLERYVADEDACNSDLKYREWTDADYSTVYDGLLIALSCLEEENFSTPGETPSLQVYIEHRRSNSSEVWDPYSELAPSELATALKACPEPDPIY